MYEIHDLQYAKDSAWEWLEKIKNLYEAFQRLKEGANMVEMDGNIFSSPGDVIDYCWELPVRVWARSGWYALGETERPPETYRILLTTGGPMCILTGELDRSGNPVDVHVAVADWEDPFMLRDRRDIKEALLWFVGLFDFGE